MSDSLPCQTCSLPVPIDAAYSDGIARVYCHACMVRLKTLRDSKVKVLEPGKCSIANCFSKSYFLIIKRLEFANLTLEVPVQFCAVHHYQIIAHRQALEKAKTLEGPSSIDFGRLVDYEEI